MPTPPLDLRLQTLFARGVNAEPLPQLWVTLIVPASRTRMVGAVCGEGSNATTEGESLPGHLFQVLLSVSASSPQLSALRGRPGPRSRGVPSLHPLPMAQLILPSPATDNSQQFSPSGHCAPSRHSATSGDIGVVTLGTMGVLAAREQRPGAASHLLAQDRPTTKTGRAHM